jgi:hypothetical protein
LKRKNNARESGSLKAMKERLWKLDVFTHYIKSTLHRPPKILIPLSSIDP